MPSLRIATFNCENLFRRFRFNKNVNAEKANSKGFLINELAFQILNPTEKKLTSRVVKETDADVLALQEVESLEVLRRFRSEYLNKSDGYTHALLIEGNDPRSIDVAVLSRHAITARSHHHLRSGNAALFSRDCLEVDLNVSGKPLTLYLNHFKSMLDKKDPKNGRKNTKTRRVVQSRMVKQIITNRFGANPGAAPFVVLGDLNDYLGQGTGIDELVNWSEVENVVNRLPSNERWTHFWDGAAEPLEGYKQIDYILPSQALAAASGGLPVIIRKGLSTKANQYAGPRYPGVSAKNVASDHCAVVFDLVL